MNLTETHVNFWVSRHARLPAWAGKLQGTHPRPSIDECINAHAQQGKRTGMDTDNTVALVKLIRKNVLNNAYGGRSTLAHELYHLGWKPHSTSPKRRVAFARKWYTKLKEGK